MWFNRYIMIRSGWNGVSHFQTLIAKCLPWPHHFGWNVQSPKCRQLKNVYSKYFKMDNVETEQRICKQISNLRRLADLPNKFSASNAWATTNSATWRGSGWEPSKFWPSRQQQAMMWLVMTIINSPAPTCQAKVKRRPRGFYHWGGDRMNHGINQLWYPLVI